MEVRKANNIRFTVREAVEALIAAARAGGVNIPVHEYGEIKIETPKEGDAYITCVVTYPLKAEIN